MTSLILVVLLHIVGRIHSIPIPIDEWKEAQILASGYTQRHCQPIPENMTLCQSVGYGNMVLPNYFKQESIQEAVLQSNTWLPLLQVSCHPEVKRFLCSLYAPVCLKGHQELKIVPCRDLCMSVKESCLPILQRFGFGWPQSLSCEGFPITDGLCISLKPTAFATPAPVPKLINPLATRDNPQAWDRQQHDVGSKECGLCNSATPSPEAILSYFCQADFVLKTKIRRAGPPSGDGTTQLMLGKKIRQFKPNSRAVTLTPTSLQSCTCSWFKSITSKGPFLITGRILSRPSGNHVYEVNHLIPWQKNNREFKQTIRRIRRQGESLCKVSGGSTNSQRSKGFLSLVSGTMTRQRRSLEGNKEDTKVIIGKTHVTDAQRERRRRARKRRRERCKVDKTLPGCRRKKHKGKTTNLGSSTETPAEKQT